MSASRHFLPQRLPLHVRLLWRAAPVLSVFCLILSVISAGALTIAMIASGRLIGSLPASIRDGSGSAAAGTTWRWLAVTAGLLVAGPLAAAVARGVEELVSARYLGAYYDLALDTGVRPYGIAHLEERGTAHRMSETTGAVRDWLFLRGLDGTWGALTTWLSGLGAFVLTATWRWWVPIVLVGAWLLHSAGVSRWRSSVFDEMLEVTGSDRRRANYLRTVLSGRESAKEIRLFCLLDWLRDSYVATWTRTMAAVSAKRSRQVWRTLPSLLLVVVLTGGAVALLARDAWTGSASTGVLVTVIQAIAGLSAFGTQDDDQTSLDRVLATLHQIAAYRADLGLPFLPPSPIAARRSGDGVPRPAAIAIRDVTFGYRPGSDPVLEDLDLEIPAGQSIAIVGANGAGKSTLIKLLAGLYPPDRGAISIDGHDPAHDPAARDRVAVIFQEFVRFGISARGNVEAGGGWRPLGEDALGRIAAETAAAEVIEALSSGWDTVLSAEYAGGTDLSGGQWQRIALARAVAGATAGAGVLVLDEPTSALDVRAEAALFDRLLTLSHGLTTILVSHRLSSVRHADRIVVLGAGASGGARVIEDGTHAELLAAQGEYATMFGLQASRFAAAGAPEGRE